MSVYTNNGTIRAQDNEARNIARSVIKRSLAQEANQTAILVTRLIALLLTSTALIASVDDLWTRLQTHSALRNVMTITDANVDAFSQFSDWVNDARFAVASAQKSRLSRALHDRLLQQRFRSCIRPSSAYHSVP